jgi:CRISPR-associated endonuclease/helicase Cas3
MNILLVSECDKKALRETRRILDQFAERRGSRTWQTAITQEGLHTLHKLLRRTARKNTAVACHWIRGLDHSELVWIVGDRSRFSTEGAVPTNTTRRNVLRTQDESNWQSAHLIRLLVDLSGLLHDLGKATVQFQARLSRSAELSENTRNIVRHEWVSLRLFEAFVGTDTDVEWLKRLAEPTEADDDRWISRLRKDDKTEAHTSPFKSLNKAPLAQAVGWLVVTHHRLPFPPKDQGDYFTEGDLCKVIDFVKPDWNEREFLEHEDPREFERYWTFTEGLPVQTREWRQRAARVAKGLTDWLNQTVNNNPLGDPFVMHLSRLCLMLADHYYSRLEGDTDERVEISAPTNKLWANTRKDGTLNQRLDEHLVGVARGGAEIARFLPRFQEQLPHLSRVRRLRERATVQRFAWQNRAYDLARSMQCRATEHGAFIVNMASTGCGKTLANARVMHALADPEFGMRCSFAMGLRTLTLQTGKAFQKLLAFGEEELAIRVGGSASRELFSYYEAKAEASGSASSQGLIDEEANVLYEGNIEDHPLLKRATQDLQIKRLLLAPVLVCTIDHLTPATESLRGGRQIAPMLRLLSGDLVVDEPDDFDIDDLPALTRLAHWAGMLGCRVLFSSATAFIGNGSV